MPPGGRFDGALSEFVLPYEAVRNAADPEALLLEFLSATHAAAADTVAGIARPWNVPLVFRGKCAESREI